MAASVISVLVLVWLGVPLGEVKELDSDTGRAGHMDMVLVMVRVHWQPVAALAGAVVGLLLWLWPERENRS